MGILTKDACLKRGDGGGTEVFTAIEEVVELSGPTGSAPVIDVTHLKSAGMEKIMGLPDAGQIQLTMHFDSSHVEQKGLYDDWAASTLRNFEMEMPGGAPDIAFSGYVTEFQFNFATNDKATATATIEITGLPDVSAWT